MSGRSRARWLPWRGLFAAVAIATAGCAVGPDFTRPDPPLSAAYTPTPLPPETAVADGTAQRFAAGAEPPERWWAMLGSPEIDSRVDRAIAGNPTLQAAQASLRQSQDQLRAGYGVFFPQLNLDLGATREAPFVPGLSNEGTTLDVFTVAGTVSYVLDVFGGERRAVESQAAQVDVQRYETAATYLTLIGNTVNASIAEAGYQAQIEATLELVAEVGDQVQIARAQARAGTVPYASVLALETQLAATEAQLPALEQRRTQARDLLATLLGAEPAAHTLGPLRLASISLPADVPLALPSELVRRRPDILSAEAQLHVASAEIGVATAALFPQITLSGSYGWTTTTLASLFTGPGAVWAVGGQMLQPVFRGGTLWFQRQAAIDAYEQADATYRQTVLGGLAQVADLLGALEHDARLVEAQARQERAADDTVKLTQINYRAGIATYLEVLVADVQKNQATIARIGGQAQRLQDTVALLVALGGRPWTPPSVVRQG